MESSAENDALKAQWALRADALGKAQSRMLWIGLVVGIFYFSLASASRESETVQVPLLGVELSREVVLSSAGPALAFIVIAFCGSLRAWGDAMREYGGEDWRTHAGRIDMHPTAFDLAHYSTMGESFAAEIVSYLIFYPTFLALLLFESAAFLLDTWFSRGPGAWVFLGLGVPFWYWAQRMVRNVWSQRLTDVKKTLRERKRERELLTS